MAENETDGQGPDPDDKLSSADGFPEHPVVESSEFSEPQDRFPEEPKAKPKGGVSVLVILMILVLAGGEFFLYQGQVNTRKEVLARLDQFQAQLNEFQQPPDVGLQNQQALKKLQRDFQNFQGKVISDLGAQHDTLEAVESSVQDLADRPSFTANPSKPSSTQSTSSSQLHEAKSASHANGPEANPKKDYIEFVESTGEKIFRLAREGAIKLFQYFASLFE